MQEFNKFKENYRNQNSGKFTQIFPIKNDLKQKQTTFPLASIAEGQ